MKMNSLKSVTQIQTIRKLPRMAMIQPKLNHAGQTNGELVLQAPGMDYEVTCFPWDNSIPLGKPVLAHKLGTVELDLNSWLMEGCVSTRDNSTADCITTFLTNFLSQGNRHGRWLTDTDPNF